MSGTRAIAFGRELERRLPSQVTTKWWKEERGERVFIDYNQNATRPDDRVRAYSVRPKPGRASVSAADVGGVTSRRARGLHRRHDARKVQGGG